MAEAEQVIYEVFYGAHAESVGWVYEGDMLSRFKREVLESIETNTFRWIDIFNDGRGVASLLISPSIPVFVSSKTLLVQTD